MSARIRVLRAITRLNIGGPAVHATILTERLDSARYQSLLVAGTEETREGNYLALHGRSLEKLVMIPALGRRIRVGPDLVALRELVRLMREVRPHIVHTHTAKAGTLGRLAARWARVPVVVHTYHGHVFGGYFSPAKTRLFLAIERRLARWTDRLLATSETTRAELLALGIGRPKQFAVVPEGPDLGGFLNGDGLRGQLRAELGLADTTPLVGIVARLAPIKAHEVFLEAAAAVVRDLPACRFLVVGDGERRAELEALTRRLELAEQVRFLGWRKDLDRLYADLDVVVLCSRNEGSPVSLVEAMAAAKPVVATCVGGVTDLVNDGVTGCLIPPADSRALAGALRELLRDPERRRSMGAAGRERVAPLGTEQLLADMDRLYTGLLREKLRSGNGGALW